MCVASIGVKRLLVLSVLVASLAVASAGCSSNPQAAPTGTPTPSAASPTATQTPTVSPTPIATPTASATVDVSQASFTALRLWGRYQLVLNDPSAGYVWSGRSWPSTPMSYGLHYRLVKLQRADYFSDGPLGHCGEDYVVGNQTGLFAAPKVISAKANANGTVTVVVRRLPKQASSDLTVVMTKIGERWYATDLLRGTGPHASIYSALPNC